MRRCTFLELLGATAAVGTLAGCGGSAGGSTGSTPVRTWSASNAVHIPELLAAEPTSGGKQFALTLKTGRTEFLAGKPTETWGVNGSSYLGPTVRLHQGDQVTAAVTNQLPEDTTLHWHGMRLPADMDGGPHQVIAQGATWRPHWEVINEASTSWYHPHPHGATAQHVFRGVAGMVIIDDDHSDALALPHDYGVDDFPCVIQDRSIDDDGSMPFDTVPTFGQMGTDMLVNGTMDAYLDVRTGTVRLRLLNASNARLYHLGFTDDRTFQLIANDSGLLPAAVSLTRVLLGPAERAEIVVTLKPGEKVTLNTVEGDEDIDEGTFSILELRAAAQLQPGVTVPTQLGGKAPITAPAGATVRHFKLQGHDAINGNSMDMMRIDEVVPAGAFEIWELENNVYSHNFHVHGVDFSIIDKSGRPPADYEAGRKDTVHVREKTTVRIAVAVGPYTDPQAAYMYHCHILRHEDAGMMGQFVVVEPGTEASTSRTLSHDQTPSSTVASAAPGSGHTGH